MKEIKRDSEQINNQSRRQHWRFVLFLLGFFIMLVGMAILFAATLLSGNDLANLGGIIFIGPIPIIIGISSDPLWNVSLAAVLFTLSIAAFLITRRKLADADKPSN